MSTDVPDLYIDGVQLGMNPFGLVMMCTRTPASGPSAGVAMEKVCNVRMSHEHAKVLAIMLRKQIKQFEASMGAEVPLHPSLLQQLGLSRKEDW